MFDQLVREPSPGKFVPSLAQRWDVNPTADEYTFYLRNDVKFHDGTPFNAEAVKYTFDRVVNPDLKSQAAFSAIGPYDSSTVVDPYTIKVKFRTGYAPFLDSVAQPFLSIVSPTAAEKYGKDFGNNPVGSGPFKFDSYTTDTAVKMVKNSDYAWAPSVYRHTGPPYLDTLTWRILSDPQTRVAALKAGEVHFMEDLPLQNYAEVQGNSAYQIIEGIMAGSGYAMMINVTKPPTDDVKVRQAMEWATDKVGIIKATWSGLFQPACSVLTSISFGYDASTCQAYSYDPQKAAALLDEAGWKLNGDVRTKDGQELAIDVYYRADLQVNVDQVTFLQASYQAIGMKVNLHGLAQAGYFDAVRRGDHNMQPWWGPATDPDVVRQYFYSANANGGTNRSRYKNPDMDKLIDEAASYTDPAKRQATYTTIQKKALDEAIMIYIADSKNIFTTQKSKVNDVVLDWSSTYPQLYDASVNA
jgi:peptide/nickel transport system substrate-binding protein